MEPSDAELGWIVDYLLTLDQRMRTAAPDRVPYPKGSIAADLMKDTQVPDRIRKLLYEAK
jgi:hypothetical protein